MSFVSANVIQLNDRMFDTLKVEKKTPWLVAFCREVDEGDCFDDDQIYKLAVMLVSSFVSSFSLIDPRSFRTIWFKSAASIVIRIRTFVKN